MKNPSFVNRELICTTLIVFVVSGIAAWAASSKTVPDAEYAKSIEGAFPKKVTLGFRTSRNS